MPISDRLAEHLAKHLAALTEAMPRARWRLNGALLECVLSDGSAITAHADWSETCLCASLTAERECFVHRHPINDPAGFVLAIITAMQRAAITQRNRADALALAWSGDAAPPIDPNGSSFGSDP